MGRTAKMARITRDHCYNQTYGKWLHKDQLVEVVSGPHPNTETAEQTGMNANYNIQWSVFNNPGCWHTEYADVPWTILQFKPGECTPQQYCDAHQE